MRSGASAALRRLRRAYAQYFLRPINWLSQALWRATTRDDGSRRILLYAHNSLMLSYLLDFAEPFAADGRVTFVVTRPLWASRDLKRELALACRKRGLSLARPAFVLLRKCDLIVLADHVVRATKYWMVNPVPKLFIGHYFAHSKSDTGRDFRLEEYSARNGRRMFYSRTFESSESSTEGLVKQAPALESMVRTVGSLRADQLIEMQARRCELRAERGYLNSDTVVLVQSTWVDSLMERFGPEIVKEAHRIFATRGWHFIFSTHPNHWHGPWAREHPWGQYLLDHESAGVCVVRPGESASESMVISDVIVTDHTSQAVMASLLNKPMVFFRVAGVSLLPGSPVWILREGLPWMADPQELELSIENAPLQFEPSAHSALTSSFLSHRGLAAERIRAEVYELLQLDDPAHLSPT